MLRQLCKVVLLMGFCSVAVAAPALKIGMSADHTPLHYKHEGRIVGVEADNAVAIGKILGREIALVVLKFDQLIPALAAGEIDVIMSGMSVTAGRSEQVMFADPYLRVGQMAIMLIDNVGKFAQPWSIYQQGIRIGIEPDSAGEAYALSELKDAQLLRFDSSEQAFNALRGNQIDLYVHDAPTSWQLANSRENGDLISLYHPLTQEQLAWSVRLGNHALLFKLNSALRTMRSGGTLAYILNRWIPVQVDDQ